MKFFSKVKEEKKVVKSQKEEIKNTQAIIGGTEIVVMRAPRYRGSRG